ncbi:MAG: HAMP domain-containing protein [Rhodobacteraceae bacterium]|nr:HAMP domain-containing protein [Paracoccaceae bacterium]
MILFGIFASQQVLSALTRLQEQKLRELAQVQLDGLEVATLPSILHQDVWEVYDTLDRAARASKGMRATLLVVGDAQGKVLAASDPRRAPVGEPMAQFTSNATPVKDLRLPSGADFIRVVAPVKYHDETIGTIAAEMDVRDLARERRQAGAYLLLANAAATLVLAVGGAFLMGRTLRPLATLAHHMGESGGTPQPIPDGLIPPGKTEVSRLMHNYNAMVGAVQARGEAERRLAARERFVSLGRLSSSLAHEINNPLGGLLNAVDTIQRFSDRPEAVRESADLLDRGLRHLRDVARATLDLHRTDMADTPLTARDFDDLRLLFAPEVARFSQNLTWQITAAEGDLESLPAAPVRQIALNLLLNAAAAAGPGGGVQFRTASDGQDVRLSVSDTGPGLPPEARARIFEDGPAEPGGGVGLRLVRDLARGLGGMIAHDRNGGETVLTVTLPIRREGVMEC